IRTRIGPASTRTLACPSSETFTRAPGGPSAREAERDAVGMAERGEEHDALAGGVRREEVRDLVVEESETGRAEAERVGSEVEAPAGDPALQLRRAIAAVTEVLEHAREVGQAVDVHGCVGGECLPEREAACRAPEVALPEQLERALGAVVEVGAGREPLDCVHDQVEVEQRRGWRAEEVGRNAARGSVERGAELFEVQRALAVEDARGAAAADHGVERFEWERVLGNRREREEWPALRWNLGDHSAGAPRRRLLAVSQRRSRLRFADRRVVDLGARERLDSDAKLARNGGGGRRHR